VALVVVLFQASAEEPTLGPGALEELARIGVTNVALLGDGSTAGLVLEGWSFDPKLAPRATRAVAGACDGVRMLLPLMQMAVSAAAHEGGGDDRDSPTARA
jgi:hypothetical protein